MDAHIITLREENESLKQWIEELERRDELYRLVMEVPNEGLWDWNPITKELLVSSRLMETLGHNNRTTITTTHEWLQWVHPDDIEDYEAKVSEHLKGLTDYFEWEYRVRDTSGKYHWVLARGKALRDDKGVAYRMVGSVGDITKRRNAEDELKKAHAELEKRVEERTAELVRINKILNDEIKERRQVEKELKLAKEAAENAHESKNKYLAAASHDLLQPLNAARILLSTLQERSMQPDNLALVNRTQHAMESAEELLIDLLDIAKLDANAMSVDLQYCQMNRLLHSLEKEVQSIAKKAHASLHIVPCSLSVLSDNRLLRRVLRNFLHNAFRHAHGKKVVLGCRRKGNMLRIQVWDNGCGIPQNMLREIFKEYRQLDNQIDRTTERGVGLGLAIVERISKVLDHPVHVESQIGGGSCFSIDVPCCGTHLSTEPQHETPTEIRDESLKGHHFLIVENDQSIMHSMSVLLSQWGAVPHCAFSLFSALGEMDAIAKKPTALLVDYHLDDGENGLDVIDAIQRKFKANIPCAMVTADRSPELQKKCQDRNIAILNKPIKTAKLKALLSHFAANA